MTTSIGTVPRPVGRARYGLDAPGWVAMMFAGGAFVMVIGLLVPAFATTAFWWGGSWLFMGLWFLLASFFFKPYFLRPRVLAAANLLPSSRVLDLGTGRGLLAVGAAKVCAAGRATGIDIWSNWDLAGNSARAARENAEAEGVAERVDFIDADMRALPFPTAFFDAVVSASAIHNISLEGDRQKALAEAMRVLKPGGRLSVCDLAAWRYAKTLKSLGAVDVRVDYRLLPMWGWSALVTATKPTR
jgi:SAM-dependent methyltransferase